jgi:hypothetical protein
MTRMALQRPANDLGDARAVVEAAALARVGARTLERGRRYVAWGAVFDGRRRGAVLRARCEGSGQEAWRVRVTLDPTGVRDAACDCPMGEEGDCKHVAAVLLTYAKEPEAFAEVPTVDEALEGVDASGLRALLGRLLLQRPELEALVEEALPAAFARPAEAAGARGRAAALLRGVWPGDDLDALASGLEALRSESDDLREVERLAVAIVGRRRRVGGDAGPVLAVARRCVESVAAGLRSADAEARARGLRWLVGLYGYDIEHGCAGVVEALGRLAVTAALAIATADERRALARRVRGAMARGDEWARYAWGAVLVELEEGLTDDEEAWMELARAHHRPSARCRRLLALGRVEEAWAALSEVADVELLTLAERFEERGLGAEYAEAVKARAARAGAASRDRLVAWLRGREERADVEAALGLAEGVLAADPTRAALDELRLRAEALGRWGEVRERAEAVLDAKAPAVLVAWLLDQGELAAARRVAEDERARPMGFAASRVAAAEALEESDPEGAARVYLRQAEACVAQRGRAAYRDACAMLARVERVLSARGREAESRALREGFAARHARLSSLRAELVQHFGPLAA